MLFVRKLLRILKRDYKILNGIAKKECGRRHYHPRNRKAKEQPSTDDDDDSEVDEDTADVAAIGGARMKAGEESSWERLIAEQNRQLEEYRRKGC